MPLRALVSGESVVAPSLDPDAWAELRSLARGSPEQVVLPGCGLPGYPRLSRVGLQHFAHRPGSQCTDHVGESGPHLEAKAVIVAAAESVGWRATPEAPRAGWVADVLAEQGGRHVALEVQWSRQTPERYRERQAAYADSGVRAVWFARHGPPAPTPDQALPGFGLQRDEAQDGHGFKVTLRPPAEQDAGVQVALDEAVRALLDGRVRFRTRVGRRGVPQALSVSLWELACWKCRRRMTVWETEHAAVRGSCGVMAGETSTTSLWSARRPEAQPPVVALATTLAADEALAPAASIRWRRTQPVPQGYQAFCCPHCNVVQGDFHLRQELLELKCCDEPPVAARLELPESTAIAASAHWCIDVGAGHCPE